jgi:hypothetical protein
VKALRQVGATVEDLHKVGVGCPDLLVGFRQCNYLIEVKTLTGKLRPGQVDWHHTWRGQVATIQTVEQALALIGALR